MHRPSYVVGSVPVILVVALVIVAGFWAAAPPTPTAASLATGATQVAKGKRLFDANCAVCHKTSGVGGLKLGNATSADLRGPGLEETYHTDARLRRAILDGKDEDGKPLDPVMPRWRGKLSRQEVRAIIAFLKSLHK